MRDFNQEISTEFKTIRRTYTGQINDISEQLLLMNDENDRVFLMTAFGVLFNTSGLALNECLESLQDREGKTDILDLIKEYSKKLNQHIEYLEHEKNK